MVVRVATVFVPMAKRNRVAVPIAVVPADPVVKMGRVFRGHHVAMVSLRPMKLAITTTSKDKLASRWVSKAVN